MKKLEQVLTNLDNAIDFLETEQEDILSKAEEGILITKRALEQLRNSVTKKKFKNKNDEIHFFKHIKPQVFSKLIYYQKLFNIESKRPRS